MAQRNQMEVEVGVRLLAYILHLHVPGLVVAGVRQTERDRAAGVFKLVLEGDILDQLPARAAPYLGHIAYGGSYEGDEWRPAIWRVEAEQDGRLRAVWCAEQEPVT